MADLDGLGFLVVHRPNRDMIGKGSNAIGHKKGRARRPFHEFGPIPDPDHAADP
jgi:hypothetical protein